MPDNQPYKWSSNDRLYGTPGAENLYDDLASAYENLVDDMYQPEWGPVEIDEWTTSDPESHVRLDPEYLLEYIVEGVCDGEMSEGGWDAWSDAAKSPVVREVTQAAIEMIGRVLASKVQYRMADKHVNSHWITWDDYGRPYTADNDRLLDGTPRPLYRINPEAKRQFEADRINREMENRSVSGSSRGPIIGYPRMCWQQKWDSYRVCWLPHDHQSTHEYKEIFDINQYHPDAIRLMRDKAQRDEELAPAPKVEQSQAEADGIAVRQS